jgi:hypothetical protein
MDDDLRTGLWNLLTHFYFPQDDVALDGDVDLASRAHAIWTDYFKWAADSIPNWWQDCRDEIKKWFFEQADWFDVYDFLEFCLERFADQFDTTAVVTALNEVLERERSGYRAAGARFVKSTSEAELDAIDAAQSAEGAFSPVGAHLRSALDHLSRRPGADYRNSIKESISAVEAACRVITGTKLTLADALKEMERKGFDFHGAQKDAFIKLYSYTSDAKGIRHALLDEPSLNYEDALFMLVTCSAFVNFLRVKAKV